MTKETEDRIKREAEEYALRKLSVNDTPSGTLAYIAGATPYASKLEEAERENLRLKGLIEIEFKNKIISNWMEAGYPKHFGEQKANDQWPKFQQSNNL